MNLLRKEELPRSISHWLDPFAIVAIIGFVYISLRQSEANNLFLAISIIVTVAVVMGIIEFARAPWSPFFPRRATTSRPSIQESVRETSRQWLGMLGYFLIILSLWWLLAEYYRDYYQPFFAMLPLLMVGAPLITALVLFLTERFAGSSERGGRELGILLGRIATGSFKKAFALAKWNLLRDELLSWFLWGFFLPLNFVELVRALGIFRGQEYLLFSGDWLHAQYLIIMMIYAALIAAITPGYMFASRIIRTETKAVDHSWFAWTITLICYDPIVSAVFGRWLDYRAAVEGPMWMRPWASVFEHSEFLLIVIGGLIIFCELIHLWGEAQFGLRASNISNRGIITTGLFRLTKHPIYVSKCAGWFLMYVPFLAGGTFAANLRLTILWVLVCVVYMLRSLAEERLLAKDRDYVAYALYMDKHGMFAWVGKYVPFITFKYRLERWQKSEGLALPRDTNAAHVALQA